MMKKRKFIVDLGWQGLAQNLGLKSEDVLRHAKLPLDLFAQKEPTLDMDEYFRLWASMSQMLNDPAFAIRVVQALQVDVFSPPMFAAFCSPNLNVAAERLSLYKPLIGPLRLEVSIEKEVTRLTLGGLEGEVPPPPCLIAGEMAFVVNLARLGTREHIVPIEARSGVPLENPETFDAFFGLPVVLDEKTELVFSAEDAARPFLSANDAMFAVFEPELRRRLADLSTDDTFQDRVRACLMEALASGQYSMADVADQLAVSTRTLQRRLQSEDTNFQNVLNGLREDLARHYLSKTQYSSAEISFLLGYDDPNSFIRAFHGWTGATPERLRQESHLN